MGDWRRIEDHGAYDLLVLDCAGQGKDNDAADPARLLESGGAVVIDDFAPGTTWPPHFNGARDLPRLHWVEHPDLHTTELRLAPDLSVVVGTRLPVA
ncbi:hypothetical protein [Wenjunlia tyrosinilytica]|jgi:predicted O-methyltransferase YrrM|uniref:Uncharacterized protein n=1 Tax=Wenjunlia tyrosinilytica TaxID=1544741 RepID=A0A918E0G8_9ACTN|nr:hypothetical protein [Wenjunlia tyrosinilytica]GGO94538.1 hypothetical protein GCM10012280_49680 [Wenjunlia tyrosinilytica]